MENIKNVLLVALFLISFNSTKAQNVDGEKRNIKEVVKLYLRVTDLKDSSAIEKAFHPEAKLMSVNSKGELKQMTQNEWWQRVSKIPDPVVRKSRITVLDIAGVSAVVKVEFKKSIDFITLLKLGNEWKIVNKSLSVVL